MKSKQCPLAVHAVFLPRENIFFIKEWLFYHSMIGVEHFYLYDNTGSIGDDGSTQQINKYGIDFHSMTSGLSDTDVRAVLEAILAEFGDRCTLIDWQPRDEEGRIIFGLGDSIRHCMQHYSSDVEWLCAIDIDEYLFSPKDIQLGVLLKYLRQQGSSRGIMLQKKFADRFLHMDRHVIDIDECIEGIDTSRWAPKVITLTEAFDDAVANPHIHDIPVSTGKTHWFDPGILRFNHYNVNDWQLNWMKGFYNTEVPFTLNATDAGMARYREAVHAGCKTFGSKEWRAAIMELEEPV